MYARCKGEELVDTELKCDMYVSANYGDIAGLFGQVSLCLCSK